MNNQNSYTTSSQQNSGYGEENLPADWSTSAPYTYIPGTYQRQTSPLSSSSPQETPGIYTPADNDGWNCFDQSFSNALEQSHDIINSSQPYSTSLGSTLVSPNTAWGVGYAVSAYPNAITTRQGSGWPSSVASQGGYSIQEAHNTKPIWQQPTTINPQATNSPVSTPTTGNPFTSPTWPNQASQQTSPNPSISTRRESKSSTSSRRSSAKTTQKTKSNTRPTTSNSMQDFVLSEPPRLRTAETPRSSHSRRRADPAKNQHNMVEKQYRERLNAHFKSLLAKIPPEVLESSGASAGSGNLKNVTKTETLMLAEAYIKSLLKEQKVLEGANSELQRDFEELKKEWEAAGGMMMP